MKLPHAIFGILNKVMLLILRSPLHGLFSGSVLAIGYTGVRSGRQIWVPVRYLRRDDEWLVVTGKANRWWPNFKDGLDVRVLVGGVEQDARGRITVDQPDIVGDAMRALWAVHPSDAAYMDVKMRGGVPDEDDFARAVTDGVVVHLAPATTA
jgi:hypothetical protein